MWKTTEMPNAAAKKLDGRKRRGWSRHPHVPSKMSVHLTCLPVRMCELRVLLSILLHMPELLELMFLIS